MGEKSSQKSLSVRARKNSGNLISNGPILLVWVTQGKFELEELIWKLFTVKPQGNGQYTEMQCKALNCCESNTLRCTAICCTSIQNLGSLRMCLFLKPYTVKLHLVPLHGHFSAAKFLALIVEDI